MPKASSICTWMRGDNILCSITTVCLQFGLPMEKLCVWSGTCVTMKLSTCIIQKERAVFALVLPLEFGLNVNSSLIMETTSSLPSSVLSVSWSHLFHWVLWLQRLLVSTKSSLQASLMPAKAKYFTASSYQCGLLWALGSVGRCTGGVRGLTEELPVNWTSAEGCLPREAERLPPLGVVCGQESPGCHI